MTGACSASQSHSRSRSLINDPSVCFILTGNHAKAQPLLAGVAINFDHTCVALMGKAAAAYVYIGSCRLVNLVKLSILDLGGLTVCDYFISSKALFVCCDCS